MVIAPLIFQAKRFQAEQGSSDKRDSDDLCILPDQWNKMNGLKEKDFLAKTQEKTPRPQGQGVALLGHSRFSVRPPCAP
jgi:hypothetical protein